MKCTHCPRFGGLLIRSRGCYHRPAVINHFVAAAIALTGSLLIAALSFNVRHLRRRVRRAIVAGVALIVFAIPVVYVAFVPDAPMWLAAVVVLLCPIFAVKLIDSHIGVEQWRQMTVAQWIIYLVLLYVLCYRRHQIEPQRVLTEQLTPLIRGVLEVTAGALLLHWTFHHNVERHGFWVEHFIKLIAVYLLLFDGWFVLMTGVLRLFGCNVLDLSRHPILATTPADFWRRYNRDPGQFFFENVFKRVGGLRHPIRGIFVVFIINGLLHEYLATLLTRRVTGFMLAFFLLHATAVAATYRWRPHSAAAVVSWLFTLLLLIVTSVIFFAPIDMIIPWYVNDLPGWVPRFGE